MAFIGGGPKVKGQMLVTVCLNLGVQGYARLKVASDFTSREIVAPLMRAFTEYAKVLKEAEELGEPDSDACLKIMYDKLCDASETFKNACTLQQLTTIMTELGELTEKIVNSRQTEYNTGSASLVSEIDGILKQLPSLKDATPSSLQGFTDALKPFGQKLVAASTSLGRLLAAIEKDQEEFALGSHIIFPSLGESLLNSGLFNSCHIYLPH